MASENTLLLLLVFVALFQLRMARDITLTRISYFLAIHGNLYFSFSVEYRIESSTTSRLFVTTKLLVHHILFTSLRLLSIRNKLE